MRETKLIWQLFLISVLILMGAMLAVAWYGTHSLRSFHIYQMTASLIDQSRLVQPQLGRMLAGGRFESLKDFCVGAGRRVPTRLTVIDMQGKVLCDSERDPGTMKNHADRPEIAKSYQGEVGVSRRYSATLKQQMLYVAIPLSHAGKVLGVLRASVALTAINSELRTLFIKMALGMLLVTVLAGIVTLFVARNITRPLELMKLHAGKYAGGDFSRKVNVTGSEEIVGLAKAMNRMATQLGERIRAEEAKRNELETVLASMVEGVLAVDLNEKILYMNKAAMTQLGTEARRTGVSSLLEVVRNIDLLRFIQLATRQDGPVEKTIFLNKNRSDEKILKVHGAQLSDAAGKRLGALVVINDVTRLLHLENLRRDFVANVSHELKTPITSIKGYVETLLDETEEHPQHVKDFLQIISRQANRLQAIVEDLLALAQIEQQSEQEEIVLEKKEIKNILHSAIESCAVRAAAANVEMSLKSAEGLYALINGPLLEQAVINLLDNAIKYSAPGSTVDISAAGSKKEIVISVRDTGIGIARQDLERLFERFYVVDKGRSRASGGTGLGLAIVKHIVQAHRGNVTVESEPGKGSVFSIRFPRV
ncbi:MAG: HAMP domain-containing protein [Deltaproteobacteria bacterium]|nr:HAMP domain-containing protein [Deltaproteobacteria bacterium]